jgi:MoaA/NifB/PqqE/SkfB family radical SAM enzyme
MDHHNIAMIRGDRKSPSLQAPQLDSYKELYDYVEQVWKSREKIRFGAVVEPMLQFVKCETAKEQRQVVLCQAGIMSAVIYANGDVGVCESLPPIGNLREKGYFEIWDSAEAQTIRKDIRAKKCFCTNEIFLWPSITFQPYQLMRALYKTRLERKRSAH